MNKKIVVVSLIALALCSIIGQVANATFVRISGTPGSSGEDDFYGMATDGQDVFYVASGIKLVKFTGATNARAGMLALTGLTSSYNGAITAYGGNVFVADWNSPTNIVKVAASTLTAVGTVLALQSGEQYAYAMVSDGSTNLYVTCNTGKIVKVKMSDLTRVSVLTLADGELYALAIDAKHLYVATDDGSNTGKQLTRVVLSTFLEDSAITFEYGETDSYTVLTDSTASACTYAYVGMDVSPGIIVKVSCSPFQRVSSMILHSANDVEDMTFDASHTYIYAVSESSPFAIVQVKVSDLSTVTTLVGDAAETYAYYIRRVGDNSLFVGTTDSPGVSVKFSIDAPTPAPNTTTAAPLSVGATESKIVVAALVALMSVVLVMA